MRMFFPPSHSAYSQAMSLIGCVFYYRLGPIFHLKKSIPKFPPQNKHFMVPSANQRNAHWLQITSNPAKCGQS